MNPSAQRFTNPKWMDYGHVGYPWTSFSNYPHQRNHQIPQGDEGSEDRETLDRDGVAFHLSWHTFGLLEAVLCRNVQYDVLLQEPSVHGHAEMTLDRLKPMLQSWVVKVFELSNRSGDTRGYLNYAAKTQRAAFNQFMGLVARGRLDYPGSEYVEVRRLMNYVACLGEALWITTEGLFYKVLGPDTIPPGLMWSNVPTLGDDTMYRVVIEDGWCPSVINYLNTSANLTTLRLALLHGPLYEEHHSECTGVKCALTQVDTDNYVVQHISEGCTCSFVTPDMHRITELLRQATIPVIGIKTYECAGSSVSMSVIDGSNTEFVAFSHVWADGLGSTAEAGLPICQLRRLAAMASSLVESGAFWIDGLCVPKDSDLRNRAIGMMADTYREAKVVLVLDSGILATSSTMDRTEILLRVCMSHWMRRLWTFQEAVLAKDLHFKLSDAAVPIMSVVPEFKEQLVDPILTGLGFALAILAMRAQNQVFGVTDIARAIQWRSTSKMADETLAIAGLLNTSASMLASAAPSDRIRLLLLAIRKLPKSFPFLQGEKLQTPGFRWAPSTLLSPYAQQMPRHDTLATCTPEGLISEYYALVFDEVGIEQNEHVCLDDIDGAWAYIFGPEIPETGAYRCNAILLLRALSPGDTARAIAVLFDRAADISQGTPLIPYLYQRQVLIGRLDSPNTSLRSVTVLTHGQLKVRIS
ncbi:hypothetical protein FOXYS1_5893 [Fusarium oxysporum]|uniref:Heterokaryon incompatibility domain-containing protein n=1 Tax=Fusarium oxysporum TaxID=5507 RepID=A0A8H5AG04_FUSOX|nr:hypothetical protein FOXYS1_5893 [Fusarium oxysporum]